MAENLQGLESHQTCIVYKLKSVAVIGVFRNCFVLLIHIYEDKEEFIVYLTVKRNKVLYEIT